MKKRPSALFTDFKTDLDGKTAQIDDASPLQTLYPTAKTSDEVHQDNLAREELMRKRLPKFAHINIALSATISFGSFLLFSLNVGSMWETGSSGMVFLSFGIAMLIALIAGLGIKYTIGVFYAFGFSMKFFALLYAALLFGFYAMALYGIFGETNSGPVLLAVTGGHLVATYLLALFTLPTGTKRREKKEKSLQN